MRVAYIGNFGPRHSTENHVARAWEHRGHSVLRMQENHPGTWAKLGGREPFEPYDLLLWTRTGWDWPASCGWSHEQAKAEMWRVLRRCAVAEIPTVGFHLDRWWGLGREGQVVEEPFFSCDYVVTADGGHDDQWAAAGVNHVWMPPAVSLAECAPGTPHHRWESPVTFVGSWRGGYHAEHTHRERLVRYLQGRGDCRFWPAPGQPAVRNEDLRDLYASTTVVVGDSCFVGDRYTGGEFVARYWSDRIPETLGRGGFLLHPLTPGLEDVYPDDVLVTFSPFDWDELGDLIDYYRDDGPARREVAAAGRDWVLSRHTYEVRVGEILDVVGRGDG